MSHPAEPKRDRVRELIERELGDIREPSYSHASLKLFAERCVRAALRQACDVMLDDEGDESNQELLRRHFGLDDD